MKKFLGILAIAGALVACNNSSDTTSDKKDSIQNQADSAKKAVENQADTTQKMIQNNADTAKKMVDSTKHK